MKYKPLYNHDLIKLLRSFTPKEQKRFLLFLGSDYFTTRKALLSLYKELIKFHPLYRDVNCSKESLYSVVYPDLEYNGGTMRDLLSELLEAAIEFTSIEAFNISNEFDHFKIDELRKRGLFKNSQDIISGKLETNSYPLKVDSDYFIECYRMKIKDINLKMICSKYYGTGAADRLSDDFKKAEEYLLMYYFLENTANISNFLIFEERLKTNDSDQKSLNKAKELYNSNLYKLLNRESSFHFAIETYKTMIDAFYHCGVFLWFEKYVDSVKKYSDAFTKSETAMHYSKLIACCILSAKYGKEPDKFNFELLNIYYAFLEKGYYKNDKTDYIPSNLFRAIVLHAIKMKKLPWLLRVINRFSEDIIPRERENMKRFAMAFYYYASGRNGKALETIAALNITQFIFKYDIYNLRLRIYYEERNLTAALELIHSYSQFLRNDKMMPASRKAFHRAFNKYAKRLISITEGSDKFEAGLEIKKLQSENCVYKDWLTEKFSLFAASKRKYGLTG